MKDDNKYELIVSASIHVMKEKGFEKASVSQIVKEAGVAQGTFYLYFDSKSAVVPAIARRILTALLSEVQTRHKPGATLFETIEMMVEVTFELTEQYKEMILFCYSGMAYYHSFELWEEIYQPYYQWLEQQLKAAKDSGSCTANVELHSLSRMIINVMETSAENFHLSNQRGQDTAIHKQQVIAFISNALTDSHS